MIINFNSKLAKDIYDGTDSRYARKLPFRLKAKARRRLDQINAVTKVESLMVPPQNKLKKLTGNYKDYWRIKIDKQYAIIFKWQDGNAVDVDIVDYH